MAALLELSHELLHCIFIAVHPADLSALSQTCHSLQSYIHGNKLLFKELYCRRYDPPACLKAEPDWEAEVHRIVRMERILESNDRHAKREELAFVADAVCHLLDTASVEPDASTNVQLLAEHFESADNRDVFLCSSGLWTAGGTPLQAAAATPALRQASAKLHCLYGKPIETAKVERSSSPFTRLRLYNGVHHLDITLPPSAGTRSKEVAAHMVARAKVYDLREYTTNSLWGPFRNDGSHRVDWEKMEAILCVLGFNLRKYSERNAGPLPVFWETPFSGATPQSYVSPPPTAASLSARHDSAVVEDELKMIRELAPDLDALDPYGVTGTWRRIVCFLDYNDLYTFNFSDHIPREQARTPIDTDEAIRLIRIKLKVTRIEPPGSRDGDDDEDYDDERDDDDLDWSGFKGERLPVVHFRGTSRSLHASWDPNANSRIRGTVRQTPEGEIRWTTFSIFHGEERWRSEGIQVGGLRSARGVVGNWFDKDFDHHGPAGPTAFMKETDELEDDLQYTAWLPQ